MNKLKNTITKIAATLNVDPHYIAFIIWLAKLDKNTVKTTEVEHIIGVVKSFPTESILSAMEDWINETGKYRTWFKYYSRNSNLGKTLI